MSNHHSTTTKVRTTTKTPSNSSQDPFRATISLNNTGVVLLELHCYEQALETLSDAIAVWKMIEGDSTSSMIHQSSTADKLHQASQRLMNPEILYPESAGELIRVYSNLDNMSRMPLPTLYPSVDANCRFPLRIDQVDEVMINKGNVTNLDMKITVLILIRNCTVAYQCIAATTTGGSALDLVRENRWYGQALGGLKSVHVGLLCLSRDELFRLQQQEDGQSHHEDTCIVPTRCLALLKALVVYDLGMIIKPRLIVFN